MRNPYFLTTCLVLVFNIYAIAQVTTADAVVSSAWNQLTRWGSRENSSGRILIATSRYSFVFS